MLMAERYEAGIYGVLNCYDRVVISGHLQPLCYAKGMTKYLYTHDIRIFGYTKFAESLLDAIRTNAQALATANGLEIEWFIAKHNALAAKLKQAGLALELADNAFLTIADFYQARPTGGAILSGGQTA